MILAQVTVGEGADRLPGPWWPTTSLTITSQRAFPRDLDAMF